MSIKKYIRLLLLTSMLTSCYEAQRDCTKYRTGNFSFSEKRNGKILTSTFTRTDSLQIETFNGKKDTATIRWVNDCEYILQKKHPKNRQEKKAIAIRILSTTNEGYQFEYSFVGESKKEKGFVTKIN